MPIWLRKFTFKEIKDFYEEEKKQYEEAKNGNSKNLTDSSGQITNPEFFKNIQPKVSYDK